jgi:hypothetical protein
MPFEILPDCCPEDNSLPKWQSEKKTDTEIPVVYAEEINAMGGEDGY